ncbi:hypothetical protein EX895_004653 [Sporisorium graminicola]|uniref:Mediator of RNA polymerase II transcription subunit 11 n=1 Tax=Sporisorium graminicola TaxID=280036 RepID=A0A4U7KQ65_9BASI|nr:hypothetical protein EX895_004653 [Sporisorium graminicola]TKY86504.1 hypothetical protein EX895_004653 [Sporisorium graminicola]
MASSASTSSLPFSQGDASLDVLPAELQNTVLEGKFAQIRQQRQEARTVLREAKQRTRNQQTDQQILLLMQADERLAALLSQAADSMRALLPVNQTTLASYTDDVGAAVTNSGHSTSTSSHGPKAFEEKAQQWFSILNEVQYSLRSAVRFLREAQLAPLTPPAAPEARSTGRAGSASRGHNLSLLEAFVDIGSLEGTTFKLPPADPTAPTSSPFSNLPESNLSLQALRERHHNWQALSSSLQQINQSMTENKTGNFTPSPELSLLESIKNGCSSDRILLDALVNT